MTVHRSYYAKWKYLLKFFRKLDLTLVGSVILWSPNSFLFNGMVDGQSDSPSRRCSTAALDGATVGQAGPCHISSAAAFFSLCHRPWSSLWRVWSSGASCFSMDRNTRNNPSSSRGRRRTRDDSPPLSCPPPPFSSASGEYSQPRRPEGAVGDVTCQRVETPTVGDAPGQAARNGTQRTTPR